MAIGIVAFAFVAIFGLIPVGLNTFRAAMDTSVRSQIAQRVVFEAQQTDPKTLENRANDFRYFDDEGTEVKPEDSIYMSTLTLLTETQLPETAISSNLMTLTVKIAHTSCACDGAFRGRQQAPRHYAFRIHRPLQQMKRLARASAFTLVEVMVATTLLSVLLLILAGITNQTSNTLRYTTSKVEQFRSHGRPSKR